MQQSLHASEGSQQARSLPQQWACNGMNSCTCLCPDPRVLGRQVELGLPVSSIGASWLSHSERTSNDEGEKETNTKKAKRALWELKVADMTTVVVRVGVRESTVAGRDEKQDLPSPLRFGQWNLESRVALNLRGAGRE